MWFLRGLLADRTHLSAFSTRAFCPQSEYYTPILEVVQKSCCVYLTRRTVKIKKKQKTCSDFLEIRTRNRIIIIIWISRRLIDVSSMGNLTVTTPQMRIRLVRFDDRHASIAFYRLQRINTIITTAVHPALSICSFSS